jgi:hypothetical protein
MTGSLAAAGGGGGAAAGVGSALVTVGTSHASSRALPTVTPLAYNDGLVIPALDPTPPTCAAANLLVSFVVITQGLHSSVKCTECVGKGRDIMITDLPGQILTSKNKGMRT